jgi:peptide/nickel transport system substrate-binding protein
MNGFNRSISRRSVIKAAGAAGAIAAMPSMAERASAFALRQDETPVEGGTLTYGNGKPSFNIISPLNTVGTGQNVLIEAMFIRLVYGQQWGDGINPAGSGDLELAVAESVKEIEPNRIWEFTIRDNVKWHDGNPVTADDVIFGIWLSLNKDSKATSETPVVGILGGEKLKTDGGGSLVPPYDISVEGATKVGDNVVRIELEKPIPNYWVNWSVGYWPMPTHIFAELPLDQLFAEPYATMPIGNGPFKAAKYVDGQYMEMDAFPDFYAGKPHVDKYIVRFGDPDTLTAALEAQEIDGTGVPAGPVFDRLTGLDFVTGNVVPRTHPEGFTVNFERFPDMAGALNTATMMALDIPTLSEQLYSSTLRPSNYLFEHVVGLETPPAGYPTYTYDPEGATALLTEAGWDSNTELEWTVWSPPTAAYDAMAAMLAAVGIKTKYRQVDAATVIDELYTQGNYDIVFANFGPAQSQLDNWKYIKTGWSYDKGGFNFARYADANVDTLWQAALDEADPAKQVEAWGLVSMALSENFPQGTVFRQSVPYVWNNRVRGAYPYQYRLPVRPAFEKVWIAKS